MTKYLRKSTEKKKSLIWLTNFCSWSLDLLLWALIKQNVTVGAYGGAKLLTSWWLGSKEKRGWTRVPVSPSRACPSDLTCSSKPFLKVSLPCNNTAGW
jgi:hypothetical protein